jgi:hypothetical protein
MAHPKRLVAAFAPPSEPAAAPPRAVAPRVPSGGRPEIGPARGVFFALAFGTAGWLLILGLVLLVRALF